MFRKQLELADILQAQPSIYHRSLSYDRRCVADALMKCRSAELGAHYLECENCGEREYSYNSCRNRHCPKCLGSAAARWTDARCADLLPVKYFHLVFTIPNELRSLVFQNKKICFDILFKASADAINILALRCCDRMVNLRLSQ